MFAHPPAATNAPESATTALYRAALGPVNVARYLDLFQRFDEAGRAGPAWNWAAGFLTLNWLAFRQVWLAALVYVACAEGLALLVLGVGRHVLHWPAAVEWGVLGALLALCIAVPGAYGNAWLHADTRRRILRAVREARTMREACAALEQQASTPRRLWGLLALNGLLLALAWGLLAGAGTPRFAADSPAPGLVTVPALEPVPVASPAPADVPEPVSPPAPAEPETPVEAAVPADEGAGAEADASEAPAASPPSPLSPPPPPILAPAPQAFAINVGLFADPDNARKAHARLDEAGLPAAAQAVETPQGSRTRVRAGPFASRAQAEAAAARIRAMGLEAMVVLPQP